MTQRHISHTKIVPRCAAEYSTHPVHRPRGAKGECVPHSHPDGEGCGTHLVGETGAKARATTVPSDLTRQSFNIRFHGSNPELHGVALIRHAVKATRPYQHWLPVNFYSAPKEAGIVLGHREHNAVAADAATEGASFHAMGHSGAPINGRVHCTAAPQQCIAPPAGPDNPTTGTSLSFAVCRLRPLNQLLDGDSFSFLKSGSTRTEGARLDLDHPAVVHVDTEQTPLRGTPAPDVGRVGVPGSMYRQRDAVKRLWCLIRRHFYLPINSRPKSASRVRGPQAWRPEALSVEGSQ